MENICFKTSTFSLGTFFFLQQTFYQMPSVQFNAQSSQFLFKIIQKLRRMSKKDSKATEVTKKKSEPVFTKYRYQCMLSMQFTFLSITILPYYSVKTYFSQFIVLYMFSQIMSCLGYGPYFSMLQLTSCVFGNTCHES